MVCILPLSPSEILENPEVKAQKMTVNFEDVIRASEKNCDCHASCYSGIDSSYPSELKLCRSSPMEILHVQYYLHLPTFI